MENIILCSVCSREWAEFFYAYMRESHEDTMMMILHESPVTYCHCDLEHAQEWIDPKLWFQSFKNPKFFETFLKLPN